MLGVWPVPTRTTWVRSAVGLATSLGALGSACELRVGDRLDAGVPGVRSFTQLEQTVFVPSCGKSNCHSGAPPPLAPMSLEAGRAYDALVSVPSTQAPGLERVTPGAPERSYLVAKLRGTAAQVSSVGTRMPLGTEPLSETDLADIEAWIARGAPREE